MKPHYKKFKGARRYHRTFHDRPVYYIPMDEQEVRERRVLYGLTGTLVTMFGGVVLWILSMI